MSELGERMSQGAGRIKLEIVNEGADELVAFADDESGWKVWAVLAFAVFSWVFAGGAEFGVFGNNVFFTTLAEWTA